MEKLKKTQIWVNHLGYMSQALRKLKMLQSIKLIAQYKFI